MRTRFLISLCFCLVALAMAAPLAVAGPTVPQIASAMGRELDRQVAERMGQPDTPAQGVSLFMTTPVDVNDLEASNPLARQVQEEIARWFVQAGYPVQEIRKGADLLFDPATGEMLLTRRSNLVGTESPASSAIVAGTYTVTPKSVRFNIRVVLTDSQEVIAMSTMTVPMSGEVASLVSVPGVFGTPIAPTVVTLLP